MIVRPAQPRNEKTSKNGTDKSSHERILYEISAYAPFGVQLADDLVRISIQYYKG